MEILKIVILIFLQIPLIVVAQNVNLSENDRDNKTKQADLTIVSTTSDTLLPKVLENSTIAVSSDWITNAVNATLIKSEMSTEAESTSSTTTVSDMLIPPAMAEAQIEKLDVTSKKPSRLSIAAAQ